MTPRELERGEAAALLLGDFGEPVRRVLEPARR